MHRLAGWLLVTLVTSIGTLPVVHAAPKPSAPAVDLYGDPLPPDAVARLGTTRLRHAGEVECLLFLPDGTLASGSKDHTLRIWHPESGKELHRFEVAAGPVESLAVTPDGKLLASGCGHSESCIHLWDPIAGKHLRKLDPIKDVYHYHAVALSPDGKTLASADDSHTVRLWDVATGKPRTLATKLSASTLAFSPDGQLLLTRTWPGELGFLDVTTGREPDWLAKRVWKHGSVVITPDGKTMVLMAGEAVRWWDVPSRKELNRVRWPAKFSARSQPAFPKEKRDPNKDDLDGGIDFGTFSPEGNLLAKLDGGLVLRDSATGEEVMMFGYEHIRFDHLAFSRDGKRLAIGSREGMIRVLDLAKRAPLPTHGHQALVGSVAFVVDGKSLATASADGTVRLWDRATSRETHRLDGFVRHHVPLAATPDGKTLAVGERITISLRDAATGKEIRLLSVPDGVERLLFSPDGKTLAVKAGEVVRLLDAATGAVRAQTMKHNDSIHGLAFSPDGKTLAVGVRGGTVVLWDSATGKEVRSIEGRFGTPASLAFSPDGKVLAAGYGDQRIRLWDPATGKLQKELTEHHGWVNGLAYSPDGTRLASGSSDNTICLWDTTSFQVLHTFRGHASEVTAVAFSPDGKQLASSSYDKTALIWDVGR
jgi:WD40 repeat protein